MKGLLHKRSLLKPFGKLVFELSPTASPNKEQRSFGRGLKRGNEDSGIRLLSSILSPKAVKL